MPPAPIRVILPGLLTELTGSRSLIEVDGPAGQTVGEVLDQAFAEHPAVDMRVRDERGQIRTHVKVFVNGDDVTRVGGVTAAVPPGARVHIVHAVSGG